jgi:hypothetical protein
MVASDFADVLVRYALGSGDRGGGVPVSSELDPSTGPLAQDLVTELVAPELE